MAKESAFGAEPEQLRELLFFGLGDLSQQQAAPTASLGAVLERPGGQIGRYKLLNVLGEGGMGIVYLAEQEEPIRRQVALKVIKPGMDSKRVIARFEAERQALALLDHPNIAHVLDAGTTETGRPYFVMEYVIGLPITEHCDHNRLTIENRLDLFLQVCHAIHHAHQKGIIHRDIKPSNILVSMQDDLAVPKIIDFGVAKALSQPLTERTVATEDSQLLGTPEYMSPEQADMATDDIDTRSDIYSLGVLLYILLTGVLPFDSETFREGGIEHVRRIIRETDPKTPSTRLARLGDEAGKIAKSRQTKIENLARRLHRELEWIPLKAMNKERSERYRSASEFADDIENYLSGAPLLAGPPSNVYRLKKLVQKNRALVTGVVAVLVVLLSGIVVSIILAVGQARARAETQAVFDFLQTSVLASLDPYTVGGKVTIPSFLDTFSEQLETKLTVQPLAEASIQQTLGFGYWSLGLYEQFEWHTRCAVEVYEKHLGSQDYDTLNAKSLLGWAYYFQSRYKEAEPLFAQGAEGLQRLLGEGDVNTLHPVASLGYMYNKQGRFTEANDLFVKVLEIMHNKDNEISGRVMSNVLMLVAGAYMLQGRFEEAEILAKQGLKVSTPALGEQGYETVSMRYGLGILYRELGRYGEAEQLLEGALTDRRDVWGEDHPETLKTMVALSWLYYSQGRNEKAEALCDEVLKTAQRVLNETHITIADCMHLLGTVYLSQGRYHDAELFLDKALNIMDQILGEESWASLSIKNTKGKLYTAQDRLEDAEQLFDKTLETQRVILGNDHPYTLDSMNGFAVLLAKQKKYDDAERLFNEALKGRQNKLGDDHPATLESKNDLSVLYKERGRYDEAEPLLVEAVEDRRLKLGDTHPHTIESMNNLIALYEACNKPEKAKECRAKLPQRSH
jgi:serine/threonine protein kinase/Flp pilus assembly protein TadD